MAEMMAGSCAGGFKSSMINALPSAFGVLVMSASSVVKNCTHHHGLLANAAAGASVATRRNDCNPVDD